MLTTDYNLKLWNRPFKIIFATYFKQLNNLIPYEIDNVRIRYFAKNNSTGYATGIDLRINGEFVKNSESWASISVMQTKENIKDDYYYTYKDSTGNTWYPNYSVTKKQIQQFIFLIYTQTYRSASNLHNFFFKIIYQNFLRLKYIC